MNRSAQTFPDGLYAHVPFCASLCRYCDFASEVYQAARTQCYLTALEKELRARVAQLAQQFAPRTIFIGGGTPSALSIAELTRFFEILRQYVGFDRVREFTIEANPGSTDPAKLEFLRRQGVNRISFGAQSFQPHLLKLLGRRHSAEQSRETIRLARAAGFENISIDLMHGIPTQTKEDAQRDVAEALALPLEHVSAYGLSYEEGTPLLDAVRNGAIRRSLSEEETMLYYQVMDDLEAGGMAQYEISNYARPSYEAQHNLIYWRNEAYLGIGPSAASFIHWERSANADDLDAYLRAVSESGLAIVSCETLDPAARAREALILELRLRRGVDTAEFYARWETELLGQSATTRKYIKEGLMEKLPNGRYRITRQGLSVADGIMSELV
ncbi:MAG: radical SAM family heme chaperone HemW [Planctomycetota bacterium]